MAILLRLLVLVLIVWAIYAFINKAAKKEKDDFIKDAETKRKIGDLKVQLSEKEQRHREEVERLSRKIQKLEGELKDAKENDNPSTNVD